MSRQIEASARASARKKVAIIGSGCSGIAALWALKGTSHDVYLYESDGRLGGHSNTVKWKAGKYSVGVDTGFIVLNTATYRECTSLFLSCGNLPELALHLRLTLYCS